MSQLIYKKMSQVMADIGAVTKDQKNTAQGFKFRGIDQFVNALYPALVKHGVFMAPRTTSYTQEMRDVTRSNGKAAVDKHVAIMVEYDFYAEDGSKVTVGPIAAEGLDSGDKATNKALSAALKYALIQTFSIPTEDMAEADLDSPEIGLSQKSAPEKSTKPSFVKKEEPKQENKVVEKEVEKKTDAPEKAPETKQEVVQETKPKTGWASKRTKAAQASEDGY